MILHRPDTTLPEVLLPRPSTAMRRTRKGLDPVPRLALDAGPLLRPEDMGRSPARRFLRWKVIALLNLALAEPKSLRPKVLRVASQSSSRTSETTIHRTTFIPTTKLPSCGRISHVQLMNLSWRGVTCSRLSVSGMTVGPPVCASMSAPRISIRSTIPRGIVVCQMDPTEGSHRPHQAGRSRRFRFVIITLIPLLVFAFN